MPCPVGLQYCDALLDCCIQTDYSEVSQLTTNSENGAKVNNIKLEIKIDDVYFLKKYTDKILLAGGAQAGFRT